MDTQSTQDQHLTNPTAAEQPPAAPVVQPTATAPDKPTGGKSYSEAEVEALIKERLEREKKQREKAAQDAREKAEAEAAVKNQEFEKLAKLNEEKAAKLEAELKAMRLTELRRSVAEKVGIPAVLASRLIGETAEELEKDALALLETLPKPAPAPDPKKPQPGPVVTNPGANGQQGETLAEQRARIHGGRSNPFDPNSARQQGGGVYVVNKKTGQE